MNDADKRHETLLADYGGMAERVRHATLDLYRTETIIPLALAAFYAWFYSRQDITIPKWTLWIPVSLTLLGAVRQHMRYRYLNCAHSYLKVLEGKLYAAESDLGWYVYSERNDSSRHGLMRAIFWILLLGATAVLAMTGTRS